MSCRTTLFGTLAALLFATQSVAAQGTILVAAGSNQSASVLPGVKFSVPVVVDMSNATGGTNVATLNAGIGWNSTRLTLDSIRPGAFGSLSSNTSNAGNGTATIGITSGVGTTTTVTVALLWFTADVNAGTTYINVTTTTAQDAVAASVLSLVKTRQLGLCISTTVLWGDANNDNQVNIIDAQQLGRFSVGLSVANPTLLQQQGDVTNDGIINIIDAQQIARFSVSLPITSRVNSVTPMAPIVGNVGVPSQFASLQVGATMQVQPFVRDTLNADVSACAAILYNTSNSNVASVNASGMISGVAIGAATITASSSGIAAQIAVNVGIGSVPATMSIVQGDQQFAVGGTVYGVRPAVRVLDAQGRAVPGVQVAFNGTSSTVSLVLNGFPTASVTALTDSTGMASVFWFGTWNGTQHVTTPNSILVSASGLPSLTFTGNGVDTNIGGTACMLTSAGMPYCVGDYESEMLNAGITPQDTNWSKVVVAVPNAVPMASLGQTFNGEFTCGVAASSQGYCWGFNSVGQLGNGGTALSGGATSVAGGLSFLKISTGRNHACGITTANKAHCWGLGQYGQLGDGTFGRSSTVPVAVAGGLSFKEISASSTGTCAITLNGQTWCWGQGSIIDSTGVGVAVPKRLFGAPPFVKIAMTINTLCGVTVAGAVYCAGAATPQLGDGSSVARYLTFAPATMPVTARDIMPGNGDICAFGTDGSIYCWGNNAQGTEGVGDRATHGLPQFVAFGNPLRAQLHAFGMCYQDSTNIPFCTGRFAIGDGVASVFNGVARLTPVPAIWVEGTPGAAASVVAAASTQLFAPAGTNTLTPPVVTIRDYAGAPVAGVTVTFAITSGGGSLGATSAVTDVTGQASAGSWTLGASLGANVVTASAASLPVVKFVATGTTVPTVAALSTGDNQVQNLSTNFQSPLSVTVKDASNNGVQGVAVTFNIASGGGTFTNSAAGLSGLTSTVVQTNAQGIASLTWVSSNTIGTMTATAAPLGLSTLTANGRAVPALGAGTHCELTTTQSAYCYGDNGRGQVGDGTNAAKLVATAVSGGLAFTKLSDGFGDHTCGITSAGAAYCWGSNGFGELGDGTTTDRNVPVAVIGGFNFTSISVSHNATCGLTTANSLVCWGSSGYGLFVNNAVGTIQPSPTVLSTGQTFTKVALGRDHTCGIGGGGAAYCWGLNTSGQTGTGTATTAAAPILSPTAVSGGLSFTALTATFSSTCGITSAGSAYCWGSGANGQLGTGSSVTSLTPAPIASQATFTSIVAMQGAMCGVTNAGGTLCFGNNGNAQLGDGTTAPRAVPTQVLGGVPLTGLRPARLSMCARVSSGQPFCWGFNTAGQLGDNTQTQSAVLTPVRWVEGSAGTAVGMTINAGNNQGAGVGTVVPVNPAVVVRDFAGTAIVGTNVTFAIASGGGSLTGATSASSATGVATVGSWTLGASAGTNQLSASASGIPSTIFSANATVAAGSITIASGDNQVQSANLGLFVPLSVLVKDASNNPLAGVSVVFAVASGGATLNGGSSVSITTNTSGIAQVSPSVGTALGSSTITATVGAVSPVTFTMQVVTQTSNGNARCELSSTGAAYCWGDNTRGQVGSGSSITSQTVPVAVSGGLVFSSLADGVADHACGLTAAGAAYCWGSNAFGELGDGTTTDRNVPVAVSGGNTFTQLAVSLNATCGRTSAGALFCWGSASNGLYGDGAQGSVHLTPYPVTIGGTTFTSIAIEQSHACAISTSGSMYCWGNGGNGQLGDGSFTTKAAITLVPDGRSYVGVSVGSGFSCGIASTGNAFCWGGNGNGNLGNGSTTFVSLPTAVSGGLQYSSISSASSNTCARTTANAVYCWGFNGNGQLGDGSLTTRLVPTIVPGLTATSVRARNVATCARNSAGQPYCWGANFFGQLGDNTFVSEYSPIPVRWVEGTAGVAVGLTIAAANSNLQGAAAGGAVPFAPSVVVRDYLGNVVPGVTVTFSVNTGGGSVTGASAVSDASGIATVGSWTLGAAIGTNTLIASAPSIPSIVFTATSTIAAGSIAIASGNNQVAQNGYSFYQPIVVLVKDASNNPISGITVSFTNTSGSGTFGGATVAVATTNVSGLASISWNAGSTGAQTMSAQVGGQAPLSISGRSAGFSSEDARCDLDTNGAAYCWGDNGRGEVADGSTNSRNTPFATPGGLIFASLAEGNADHACGLTSAGAAYCWGSNGFGEIGDGTIVDRTAPVAVTGGFVFSRLYVSSNATCGLTTANAMICWGSTGYGLFGDGIIGSTRTTPAAVTTGGVQFTKLALNFNHVCGIATTGSVYCWGLNTNGQLGDNTFVSKLVPTLVPDGRTYIAISEGRYHTCGIATGGAMYCWGANGQGQLGIGSNVNPVAPTAVNGGFTFTALTTGQTHTCGIRSTGQAYCWGSDFTSELGDGSTGVNALSPVAVQGGLTFTSISGRNNGTCGRASNGQPHCWGAGYYGQIGDNAYLQRPFPTPVNWVQGTPGVASSNVINTGTFQTAIASTPVPSAPTVIVRDFAGTPVANVPVTFAVATGGGSVTGASTTTNASGIATVGSWTLGAAAGNNTLTATAGGLPTVTFSATALAGAAGSITVLSGNNQVHYGGSTLAAPLSVTVRDASNNPIANVNVTFTAATGAGTFSGYKTQTATTNSGGVATVTNYAVDPLPGAQTVTVSIGGYTNATFNARTANSTNGNVRCSLLTTGAAQCWGDNNHGQVGDGTTVNKGVPTTVVGGLVFSSLAEGIADHMCGLTSAGAVYCWGSNTWGQLGDGTIVDRSAPTLVAGVPALAQVAISGNATCGRTSAGALYCWGWAGYGLYADGVFGITRSTPTLVSTALTFTNIAVGYWHACGIAASGAAYCWGQGSSGQLGDGTSTQRSVPALVPDGRVYTQIATGDWYTCGVSAGAAYCWGWNGNGRLGGATAVGSYTGSPQLVSGGLTFSQVSAAFGTTCGRTTGSLVYCWGYNLLGSVGDGTLVDRSVPTLALGGMSYVSVNARNNNTCAFTSTGQPYCWGFGGAGGIGDNGFATRLTPAAATWSQGTAGTAVSLTVNAGNNQTAVHGTIPSVAPSVLVRDFAGNPKAGVSVTFTVTSGGGNVTTATVVTNASGIASQTTWTLGPSAGTNTITATAPGLPLVIFTATGS